MAIAAISSSPNNSGIGIVRVSGDDAFDILQKIFVPKTKDKALKGYTLKYGNIVDNKSNQIIDEVLVSYFIAPKSYTTENMVEINSHGGYFVMNNILNLLLENGAILAKPGEFTKLAYLNGRIDLMQAESVMDIINSTSKSELIASQRLLAGQLSQKINDIKSNILEILTNIEVSIDYPEYDVEDVQNAQIIEMLDNVQLKIQKLLDTYEQGKILKDGINVAILGIPNAGKSSLLNALLQEQRAIVTDIPGTTRDSIEEQITISGIKLNLIDTAGIRDSKDKIEQIGIEKSKSYIENSDLIIYIIDSTKHILENEKELLEQIKLKKNIVCLNKVDIDNIKDDLKDYLENNGFENIIEISTKDEIGLDKLKEIIINMYNLNKISSSNEIKITNLRHKNLLEQAKQKTKKAKQELYNVPVDLIAIYIKDILFSLNEIVGQNVTDELIDNIFSKFCLGK